MSIRKTQRQVWDYVEGKKYARESNAEQLELGFVRLNEAFNKACMSSINFATTLFLHTVKAS